MTIRKKRESAMSDFEEEKIAFDMTHRNNVLNSGKSVYISEKVICFGLVDIDKYN